MIIDPAVTNDLFTEALDGQRNKVQTFLKNRPDFSVLDVGGAMGSWLDEFVTAYLDCNASEYLAGKSKAQLFDGNISDEEGWESILAYVAEHGKFDFASCTQTLEDIRNPSLVLKMLPKVALQGYIDVPSKFLELKTGNEMPCDEDRVKWGLKGLIQGYTGHRWIFNMLEDGLLELYPKLPFTEHLTGLEKMTEAIEVKQDGKTIFPKYMLCFRWEGSIDFKIVNDDFIGPNPYEVYRYYREGLNRGME